MLSVAQILWLSPVGKFDSEMAFWLANTLFYLVRALSGCRCCWLHAAGVHL